jgi:hypothetical protein
VSKHMNRSMDNKSENRSSNNNRADRDKDLSVLDEVNDQIRNVGKVVGEFIDDSKENLYSTEEKIEDTIRAHPLRTSAIIFVAGTLLGVFLRGR